MPTLMYIGIAIIIVLVLLITLKKPNNSIKNFKEPIEEQPIEKEDKEPLIIKGVYQKRWMFSYNEKDAFTKLKAIADKHGYYIFAKVRLLDLLEPIKGNQKYKSLFYKIQAKHVDFVLCDQKLVARFIIELDDNSHDQKDRQERDVFVDTILQDVGYKVLHIRAVEERTIEALFDTQQ